MTPRDIIAALGLEPHPEGGWYRQTWVADAAPGTRPAGTAIYYLLAAGERSHWHRNDSAEIWHFHAGDPLILSLAPPDGAPSDHVLGPDLAADQRPQILVPPGHWQSARPTGGWSLVGCTVSPGFDFAHFEMAPPGWTPGSGEQTASRPPAKRGRIKQDRRP